MISTLKPLLKRSGLAAGLAETARSGIDDFRRLRWSLARQRSVESYLRSCRTRKLQIGAGSNVLKGWLNTDIHPRTRDIVFLDSTRAFPFAEGTFDYVFAEHVVEHMPYLDGLSMLSECYRVLKPEGRVRIATPDLQVLAGLLAAETSDLQQQYIKWVCERYLPEVGQAGACFAINNAFRCFGHQFLYDQGTLESVMKKAGFTHITRYPAGESDDENLRGIESHHKVIGDETMMHFETMVLEGRRPR